MFLIDGYNQCSSVQLNKWIILQVKEFQKFTIEKLTLLKLRFSQKENLKKYARFEEQKDTRYIRGTFILTLPFSAVNKFVSQISFNLLFSGDKRLLSEFLNNWGWFNEYNEQFFKYLG